VIADLNRTGIAFGAGAGFVAGIALSLLAGGADASTGLLAAIQLLAFVIAGLVAGRLSLVGAASAGGFAALLLYFGLAVVSIATGNDRHPVAFLLFGFLALVFGTAGGAIADILRRT